MVTIWSTAVVTGLLTGAGGVAPQTWDWLKHHALLRDLVAEPWPVTYDIGGEDLGLTYYVGFHLPAAAVGKIAGWQAAHAALLTWTVLGLVLALTWFAVLIGPKAPRWLIAGFVVFSGLDAVGRVALGPLLGMADPALPSNQLDWWAVVAKYPNHLTSVMWAPHHAIAGWIGAGSILYLARTTSLRWALPVIAGCGLISPFVTIGLLPLLGYAVLAGGDQRPVDRLRSSASLPALAAAIAVGPVLLYFGARTQPLPAPFGGAVSSGFALTDPIRPIDPGRAGLAYALFVVLELGVFVALLRRSAAVQTRRAQMLLATIVATMVTIPLYRYGAWSDLAMRAVGPAMFALAVLVARTLTVQSSGRQRTALLAVLAIGTIAPLSEASRALTDNHANSDVVARHVDHADIDATSGIADLADTVYEGVPRFVAQHTSAPDTVFDLIARD